MKIGELALATHTRVETIRYYEREGLLPQAPRSEGNYRIYGPDQAAIPTGVRSAHAHARGSHTRRGRLARP